jgi:hypothetical protein
MALFTELSNYIKAESEKDSTLDFIDTSEGLDGYELEPYIRAFCKLH